MVVQSNPNYRDTSIGESADRKQRLRERFEVIKKLGQGTYGKVQLAVNKETKQEVAIKTIKKAKIENEQDLVRIRREIQIMSSIRHPHIIHIYEVFENQEKIVLIMQYASGGELYDYLGCHKKLEENEARRVFRQVASAIFYCHKNHICHRDLKLENILLDDKGNAKIADFGLSNVFDERHKLKTFCGSPLYASPEIVRGTPYSGPEVDCWSLGVLLYTLVYGAMPFDGSNFKRLVKQISEGEYFEPKDKSGASGLIRRLLTVDINCRATIRDICNDWWVNQSYDHSLLRVATDMANLTPVRLDLLLALSSSSQEADKKVRRQAPELEGIKSIQCNGYYSKSHPVHVSENGRQSITTGKGNDLNIHDIRKGLFHGAESTKECKDGLTDYKKSQEEYRQLTTEEYRQEISRRIPATTKAPPTAITADKNESNILTIVQDLIKDVISKVEHRLNMSKTELLKNTAKSQIQNKRLLDSTTDQSMENENVTDTRVNETVIDTCVEEAAKLNPSRAFPEGVNQHNFSQQNVEIDRDHQDSKSSAEATAGVNTTVGEIENISTKVETDISETTVPVQMIVFNERKNSIPNKSYESYSRKNVVQVMEPDVVIPIFNVCSNIPKRSAELPRADKDSHLKHCPQSVSNKLNEPHLKTVDCLGEKNDTVLPPNKNTVTVSVSSNVNADGMSNKPYNNDASPDIKSAITNHGLQNGTTSSESKCDNTAGDIKEDPYQTEAPKIPPRKRLLIKIPKQQKSNEKDCNNSDDYQNVYNSDRNESKVHQEEISVPKESEKLKNQIAVTAVPLTNRNPPVCSEDTLLLTTHLTAPKTPERSPKLAERKSRRDSSKRSLSLNTKTEINKKSPTIISDEGDSNVNKGHDFDVLDNILANVLDSSRTPDTKLNEMMEEMKDNIQFSQKLENKSNNSILKEEGTATCNAEEKTKLMSVEKHSEMAELRKQTEMTETEGIGIGNIQIMEKNISEEYQKAKTESRSVYDLKEYAVTVQQENIFQELTQSRPLIKSKQRSLSRTRAMSMEFESLANMPVRIIGPPKKPPGKVEIPKTFDPNQVVTSPKIEMKEIIFIPTACVSENKEKIQKKIEKVKKSVIIIPPRRKSDAGVTGRKKKYTRSKTDFIIRGDELIVSAENENSSTEVNGQCDPMYYETIPQNEESLTPENMNDETIANEMWYSAVSPDDESEECEQEFYHGSDVQIAQDIKQHRHSVDTESGYWTPPDMGNGEQSISQTNTKCKDERVAKKHDKSEKLMLQRTAFKNSKLRMKLSDEGLDMCSLSSSLESGIYSWRQEDANGKRISPDSESSMKTLSSLKFTGLTSDGIYAPIARSFKKMTFPPEHSSTSELPENCSVMSNTEKDNVDDVGRENHFPQSLKLNEMDLKLIKPSDSQSSYGSNGISDDVFESWVEKEDSLTPKEKYAEDKTSSITSNMSKINGRDKKSRNWQHHHGWHSYSTDKESSDNDDDLDLMVDEYNQAVYGTDGLWQFLKSVNQNLSREQKTTQKMSCKPVCHRSKSQESKHPDDVGSKIRPVTRSLSREERQLKGEKQLRHFVSEGKLPDVDYIDYFQNSSGNLDSTRYSSGYLASGSSLEDSGLLQKDFMGSTDCFQNYPDHISIYGTLRRDKVFHSTSTLTSPSMARRKKSLQNAYSSGDLADTCYNTEISTEDLTKYSGTSEQSRKLSLYGTMQPRRLSQQGSAQNKILLSTDDGYQLLYNERSKKGSSSEAYYESFGSGKPSMGKASSEINVSTKDSRVKDFEKLLMSDYDDGTFKRPLSSSVSNRNTPFAEPSYHLASSKPSSRNKKDLPDKGVRRVSFSSDVKTSKSDYHSSIRLNSLNKVREANEELLNPSSHKTNAYEDEQQGGSLLEALKTYGYRGIMSQKLHSNTETYEQRFNYRLPTDCLLSSGLNVTDWDNFEYTSMDNNLAYQQPIYLPIHPMEYYQCKTFAPMKRNVGEYPDLSCDEGTVFKDTLRSQRLHEDDILSRRKSLQKLKDLNDLNLLHSDQHVWENWDCKHASLNRKKSSDSSTTASTKLQRNSNSASEKISLHEQYEKDNEEPIAVQSTESHTPKQTENSIEILSEKIQALKSRCQRKSLDESKLKKQLDESGIPTTETQVCERATVSDVENKLNYNHSDLVDEQETESSESVSDRIWRKSFYSRFNDKSICRKKKSFLDSEFMSGQNSVRSMGKFNIDEEGGMEEPWMNKSLKRRNSLYSRSLPRQTKGPTPLDSSRKEHNECSTKSFKKAELLSNIERKSHLYQMIDSMAVSQSSLKEQSTAPISDKNSLKSTNEDQISKIAINTSKLPQAESSSDFKILRQEIKENTIELAEVAHSSDTTTITSNTCPNQTEDEKATNLEPTDNLSKATDNIPEEILDTAANSTSRSGNSDYPATTLINSSPPTQDTFSLRSAEDNIIPEKNLEKLKAEENSSECCPSVIPDAHQCNRLEADEE